MNVPGLHHVTAITAAPQKNIDFYTGVLGLRLVKVTINFDDPRAYHLYYGDAAGNPGTILTFFAWPNARKGQSGVGEVSTISFAIPAKALEFWEVRLTECDVPFEKKVVFTRQRLAFKDPDGIELELVEETTAIVSKPWVRGPLTEGTAILGFYGVTLCEDSLALTRKLLIEKLAYREIATENGIYYFQGIAHEPGASLLIRIAPDLTRALIAAGSVHHIAFRARTDADELSLRSELLASGIDATPVIDRTYFHSVYFHEPGGILFEIATDTPGFTVDEPLDALGTSLRLPPQFEAHRSIIEESLLPLKLPL